MSAGAAAVLLSSARDAIHQGAQPDPCFDQGRLAGGHDSDHRTVSHVPQHPQLSGFPLLFTHEVNHHINHHSEVMHGTSH